MTTRSKPHTLLSRLSAAALTIVALTPGAAAAAPIAEVHLHAKMGHTIAEDVVVATAPAGADSVRVTLAPPKNGSLSVTYDPSDLWEPEAGGAWSALLPVSAGEPEEWLFLVKVVNAYEKSEETYVSLTTTTAETPLELTVTVEPQAGAISELLDEMLDLLCPDYLNAHQNPSEAPSPSLWGACVEHEGL